MKKLIRTLTFVGVLTVVGAAHSYAQSNLVANGDFKANASSFTVWPGYSGGSNPATISSWTDFYNYGGEGLNGAGTGASVRNPFGPTNPGGRTYAFLQGGSTVTTHLLGQFLTTLTPNTQYELDYYVAGRAGNTASYWVLVNPDATASPVPCYDSGIQSANSSAFVHVTANFTTPATLGTAPNIQLRNWSVAGDNTVDYANVSLVFVALAGPPPPPTISNNGPVCPGGTVTLYYSSPYCGASGVTNVTFTWTGPGFGSGSWQTDCSGSASWSGALTSWTGVYTCTVTVNGVTSAGATTVVTVNDGGTPPTITCPPNVTVNANTGSCCATNVPLFAPTTSGVSVWSNAPAQFNKGVTTVTWTAADPCGNTATCAQSVTVTDPQPDLALVASNQQVQLTLTGGSGRAQRIESSTNLSDWTPLVTLPQTNATLQWIDPAALNLPQRFYRSLKLTALDTYVATPDTNYTYSLVSTIPGADHMTFVLAMTSQLWLTTNEVNQPLWNHWLIIVKPNGVNHSKSLLYISGGANTDPAPASADPTLLQIALETQTVVTELRMVPNQPLTFAGEGFSRSEDAFMSYTWDKFLRTGDDKWPSLLPMTKAAVRAMDTVSAFCAGAAGGGINVDAFVVMGGSKRGWTTWTTAIVDRRVVAIIPVVIDLLNLQTSFIHHYRCYGGWAPAIQDYVNMGVMDRLTTPEFGALMGIEDPYEYRARLTLPKFLLNSSGDQFFLPDSSQFYFDDLPGVKYLRYVPNTDHSIFSGSDAWATVEACYQAVLTSAALPQFSWTLPSSNSIRVATSTRPSSVKLWQATNPGARDFRLQTIGAVWQSTPLADQGGGVYVGTVSPPPQGFTAFFVELTYPGSGVTPFTFTTRVKVVPDIEPYIYPP